jgi:uncharacterized protein YbjT (DUF2867 family)
MKILVTTPTGRIGRQIVRELLAPEFSVRVITRDPAKLPQEIRAQVEVVPGSMGDASTLRQALDDVEGMFFCVPPASMEQLDARAHYEHFAAVAARTIREVETPRVVTISAIGQGRARNAGPISALHAMEDLLSESGAAIRHLRCGFFLENLLQQSQAITEDGVISYPMPGHVAIPMVATADIADVALRWLVRRDWSGIDSVAVHGAEDISFNQVAVGIERVLERPVRYEELAANAFVRSLVGRGASADHAQGLVAMFTGLARGIARAEPRTHETTTSTTLGTWVRKELLPLVGPGVDDPSTIVCCA